MSILVNKQFFVVSLLIFFNMSPGIAQLRPADCDAVATQLRQSFRSANVSLVGAEKLIDIRCQCQGDKCSFPFRDFKYKKLTAGQRTALIAATTKECLVREKSEGERSTASIENGENCMFANNLIRAALKVDPLESKTKATKAFYDSHGDGGHRDFRAARCECRFSNQAPEPTIIMAEKCSYCPSVCDCQ